MPLRLVTAGFCVGVCLQSAGAVAQSRSLTLADVLARAREQAPQVASARYALQETQARLIGASLRFQANPEVDASVGSRQGSGERSTDLDLGVLQAFEPRSRRTARIAGANAAIAQGTADIDETTRVVLRDVASAYYRALHAQERIRLLTAAEKLAAGVYSAADRRFKAGDIAVLDVNIARASLSRVRADRQAADALRILALTELRQLLNLEDDVTVDGTISAGADPDLNSLLTGSDQRPELKRMEAAIREAEADSQLAHALSKPDYGVGFRYEREERDQVLLGVFTVTLPVFSKGQELRASSSARATRLRAELETVRKRVHIEVRGLFDAYQRRLAAVRLLEADALPGLDENEALTSRSFEVGQLGLTDLLLIRREIVETRVQYLDALLEAALARIDLDASAAILR